MSKDTSFITETLKKYGFNPVVKTNGSLNEVLIKKTAELNQKELAYLKSLSEPKETK